MSGRDDFFDAVAVDYGERWTIEEEVRRGVAEREASRGGAGRILEVGCGNGRMLAGLPRGTVGVDGSAKMLKEAKRRAPGAHLVRAVAEKLPFRKGAFYRVVCVNTIHTCEAPSSVLEELARLGARALVTDARNAMHPLIWLRHRARRARLRVPYEPVWPSAWTETLRRGGWRVTVRLGVTRPLTDAGEGFRFRHVIGALFSRLPGFAPCYIFESEALPR